MPIKKLFELINAQLLYLGRKPLAWQEYKKALYHLEARGEIKIIGSWVSFNGQVTINRTEVLERCSHIIRQFTQKGSS